MRFNEMNDIERLAVLQAIFNSIGEAVSTKNPDSLRYQIDEQYRELYEQTGSKSFDVKIGGDVVGTYSIRFSKDKQSETTISFEVLDMEKLARWFDALTGSWFVEYAAMHMREFAEYYFNETGEMPDGCIIQKHITPAVEKAYIGGALKVDGESVANAINDELPSIAGFIAGGFDE